MGVTSNFLCFLSFLKERKCPIVTHSHVIEPKYPAAVERYVNLGAYCDAAAMKAEREAVVHWTDACSAAYRQAYRALGAARQMEDSAGALMAEGMDYDKLQRRTDGILARELRGRGGGGKDSWRFLGSLTCKGPVWRFDAATALCPRIYQIQDSFGLVWPMLDRLHAAAGARGYRAVVCPSPEHPDRVEHLLLPELGLAFLTSREGMVYDGPAYRRVRVDAMVPAAYSKRFRSRLRFTRRMIQALREEGMAALKEAKAAHDQLEAVYHPHVDFDGVAALTARELEGMEARLKAEEA